MIAMDRLLDIVTVYCAPGEFVENAHVDASVKRLVREARQLKVKLSRGIEFIVVV